MKKFNTSMQSFQANDIQHFSDAFDSYYNSTEDVYTEHRFEHRTGRVCIIQFYPDGKGYDVYKLTKTSKA